MTRVMCVAPPVTNEHLNAWPYFMSVICNSTFLKNRKDRIMCQIYTPKPRSLVYVLGALAVLIAFAGCNSDGGNSKPVATGSPSVASTSGFSATVDVASSPSFVRRAELGMNADASTTFSFSPDGHKLVAGNGNYISIWDVTSKATGSVYLLDKSTKYSAAAFSTDNHTVAIGNESGQLKLWDTAKQSTSPIVLQLADLFLRCVEFSPDGHWLVASSDASGPNKYYDAKLWDLTKGTPKLNNAYDLDKNSAKVQTLAFSPDSSLLATGDIGGEILLWDMQHLDKSPDRLTVNSPGVSPFDEAGVDSLAVSSGRILAVSTFDGFIWLWDLKQPGASPIKYDIFAKLSPEENKGITGNMREARSLAFSPDGRMLAAGYGDGSIHVWMLANGIVQGELTTASVLLAKDTRSGFISLRFSPDGTILAAMYSSSIKLWGIQQTTSTKITP